MKNVLLYASLCFIIPFYSFSQVQLKSEYFGSSPFRDVDNNKVGNAKGAASVYQGSLMIPLSSKTNANDQPVLWGVSLFGTYTDFDNKNMDRHYSPDKLTNYNLSLIHLRPLKNRWSLMLSVGAGIYSPHASFSKIRRKEILGNGAILAVYRFSDNLVMGGGLALNNSFGYPMVFPGIILQWNLQGPVQVEVEMMDAIEIAAGVRLNDYFRLRIFAELNGAGAFEKIDGKEMMFTHQYVNVGLQPIIHIGKGFTIPLTVGFTPYRAVYYQKRSIKAFFGSEEGDFEPHFSLAPYFSAAIRYGF